MLEENKTENQEKGLQDEDLNEVSGGKYPFRFYRCQYCQGKYATMVIRDSHEKTCPENPSNKVTTVTL